MRGVIASSMRFSSMFCVSGRMSVKTIRAPRSANALAVEENVEACVDLAVQMMDDGTKKDYAEMASALRSKRIWKGDGVVITISKGKGGVNV